MNPINSQEIAERIVRTFDRTTSKKVYEAISDVLLAEGVTDSEASELAENYENQVLTQLLRYQPSELPFEFGTRERNRLKGKSRSSKSDKPETIYARIASSFLDQVKKTLVQLDPDDFETLCAASLRIAGATEAFALRTNDEGGIDFFGRIPLRNQAENVPTTLLRTPLLKWDLLILGQAKRFNLNASIGRAEIQKFAGQIKECLLKYSGNPDPPKNRVPDEYFIQNEPCLPMFITTASFSDRVPGAAIANGIRIIDGQELAEFLLANEIGVVKDPKGLTFSEDLLSQWVKESIDICTYRNI